MKPRHGAAFAVVGWYLTRILLFVSVLIAVSQWCLANYFRATAPTTPDYIRGAIHLVRIQGSSVYLTTTQSHWYDDRMVDIAFYCGAPVIIYEVFAQMRRSKKAKDTRDSDLGQSNGI